MFPVVICVHRLSRLIHGLAVVYRSPVQKLRCGRHEHPLLCLFPDDAYDAESSYADWCDFGSWRRIIPCT